MPDMHIWKNRTLSDSLVRTHLQRAREIPGPFLRKLRVRDVKQEEEFIRSASDDELIPLVVTAFGELIEKEEDNLLEEKKEKLSGAINEIVEAIDLEPKDIKCPQCNAVNVVYVLEPENTCESCGHDFELSEEQIRTIVEYYLKNTFPG